MISLQSKPNPPAADLRYEVKYAAPETDMGRILSWIHGHSAGFVQHFPKRQVNSIYFDSASLDCLYSGLAGLSERGKLRLRWYGEGLQCDCCTLEYKQKVSSLGRKITQKYGVPLDFAKMNHASLTRFLRRETRGALSHLMAMYCYPVLMNSYNRQYFVTADGRVRLTVDSNLRFYDQRLSARINNRRARPPLHTLVVELKADQEHSNFVTDIASRYEFRATAFSKFALGLLGDSTS
jgi:SPX domain protein involved in polyphosphate accumulation